MDSSGKKWKLHNPYRHHLVMNFSRSLRSYGSLKSQDVENISIFLRFLGKKDPLLENFQNYVPKRFIATPLDVLCSNFVKLGRRKSVK